MQLNTRTLLRLAGLVWIAVGLMLGTRGVLMLIAARSAQLPASLSAVCLSAGLWLWVGRLKGRYVLILSAKRNRSRLERLGQAPPWSIFSLKMWLLVIGMIGLGVGLRKLAALGYLGGYTMIGGLYIGIGMALATSSRAYFERLPPALVTRRERAPERRAPAVGVLLVNLGTPDEPTPLAVRRFLREFLSDPLVVEAPRLLWMFVLNVIILPRRSGPVAAAYARLWGPDGSPLLAQSRKATEALARRLGPAYEVRLGMRYGKPSLATAFDELCASGCEEIRLLPLFPQYSAATTGSIQLAASKLLARRRAQPALNLLPAYPDEPATIEAIAQRIEAARAHEPLDLHIFSFHGLPEAQVRAGDPYLEHCTRTSFALAARLGLERDEWEMVFQSRFGDEPWLQPYLAEFLLHGLPHRRRVLIALPAFTADCLETLDEVGIELRREFMAAGGERMIVVESLNDSPAWIEAMAGMIEGAREPAPSVARV